MILCDKCQTPIDVHAGFLLRNPTLGQYHICDDCGLDLDRFIDRVDPARDRHVGTA